jgi:hypothetical protein
MNNKLKSKWYLYDGVFLVREFDSKIDAETYLDYTRDDEVADSYYDCDLYIVDEEEHQAIQREYQR